jgi:uncharacterized protein GlcG (DUF336 family)
MGLIMISLREARQIISAAETKAREIGQPMNIAVVDAGANLVSHVRMDGAWIGGIDISINKAYTARAFDLATSQLAAMSDAGGPWGEIQASKRITPFAGGVPLQRHGLICGAIGVSGGSSGQDEAVANAGAAAFGSRVSCAIP